MAKAGFGKLISLAQAKEIIGTHIHELGSEEVKLEEALGRVLAEDIISPIDVPHFRKSAMDGFALTASDTFGVSNTTPKDFGLIDVIMPGETSSGRIGPGECAEIATGAPLPDGTDAVVMVEYTETSRDRVTVYKSVAPGENVIEIGSDIKKGATILRKGTLLNPRLIGLLSSTGVSAIPVKAKPKVAVLSTGNELIRPPGELERGKVYDINSRTIIDALLEQNCRPIDLGIVRDDRDELTSKIIEGIEKSDLVLVSGGSSLGSTDLLVDVIKGVGEALIHGIAVKPGKPTIVGKIGKKLVIGLPGHPTSALSNFYILVVPLLRKMVGSIGPPERCVEAELTRKVASSIGRYEFLAVKIIAEDSKRYAEPVLSGSSAITTLATADGFVEIEENVEVIEKAEIVKVKLF